MENKATKIMEEKVRYHDGAIREMMIWRLPAKSTERPHGLKYRLYYGRGAERLVCYDDERGEGDHRHLLGEESAYRFVSVERLIADFFMDIAEVRNE